MTYGHCVSSGKDILATEEMTAGTARDDSKLPSCPCKDATCPQGHGSAGCQVRLSKMCSTCKAHYDKKHRV